MRARFAGSWREKAWGYDRLQASTNSKAEA